MSVPRKLPVKVWLPVGVRLGVRGRIEVIAIALDTWLNGAPFPCVLDCLRIAVFGKTGDL